MGNDALTLTNCDREPIHIPGSIQPHGCLIALDGAFRSIERHSANTGDFVRGGDLVGLKFEDVFGDQGAHDLRNALAGALEGSRPVLLTSLPDGEGRLFDVAAHRWNGASIVEIERAPVGRQGRPLELVRALISRLRPQQSVDAVVAQTPRLIRALLAYDRVMVYRFAADGSGKVVAEAKRADLESFLGQHFPASDIPVQARALYLKNTIRVISDASCVSVPILPERDASVAPLDLSFAHLRSVSPVHCEYLRNMGVAASMSISIIVGGELWGLIACHHYSPRALSMANRVAAEMFGDFFSLHLEALSQKARLDGAVRTRQVLDGLLGAASRRDDATAFLRERLAAFREVIACDGVGLWLEGSWTADGVTVPRAAVPALADFVGSVAEGKVWATHALSQHFAGTSDARGDVAGVLAVPISQIPRDYLMFFRKEIIATIEWGGNPDKTYETGPLGDRLTPRKSFAIWKETVEGTSEPWSPIDCESGEAVRSALLEVVMRQTEILAEERRKADIRHKVLNEELNHRVKNILALIKSLISQPVEDTTSLDAYVATLKGRIMALSFAHDQVIRSDGGGELRDLLEAELRPYREGAARIVLEGPDVALDARAYSVMALVLHELATNAAKYGALSVAEGELTVRWDIAAEGGCELHWTERGGPRVAPPHRAGFGSVLVARSVPFDLGGESALAFEPSGVSVRLLVPRRFVMRARPVVRPSQMIAEEAVAVVSPRAAAALDGLAVLLLEDQLVIAIDAEAMLADAGAIASTAATAAEAFAILARTALDVAVLDVHLGLETSIAVADELVWRGIPFVFATGFGDGAAVPEHLRTVPIVRKPYTAEALVEGLAAAMAAMREPGDEAP